MSTHHHLRRGALAVACAATALTVAACGTGGGSGSGSGSSGVSGSAATKKPGLADEPASTIADKAVSAMKSASSLTMDFNGTIDGSPTKFRMTMSTKGDCAGTMTMGGGTIRLMRVGALVYMKFDDAMWKSQGGKDSEAAKKLIGDRWMKTKATGPDAKDFAQFCDLDQVFGGFEGDTASKKGKPTTFDGTPVIPLIDKSAKKDGERDTAYVALEGKPYILRLVAKGGKEPGSATFSDFDKPVNAKTPAAKDTIDLDTLGG
jgi:hypothetical protein